ncbi:hypothetical protein L0668_16690 [Paraglaciecola aquimarina]|uniref:DUF481 domain-containing protein n=1 Tax=Paraglaciecola algarum TaxID=3050085 RepID=A0ABS9D9X0_9ALTE|nr:hypothetical protein [Paraglaciecola sp. G1-23]MCF2949758.1 hypothetical protein [Paraglaciecola sp. G1-23]
MILLTTMLLISTSSLAAISEQGELTSVTVNPKLWSNFNDKDNQQEATHKLIRNKFVKYSHNVHKYLGVDLSVDAYLYTNKSDNSFKWIVGMVSDLFKVRYQTGNIANNDHLEISSSYPISKRVRVRGYASNKQNGNKKYQDYSLGLAYSPSQSLEIFAGYSDREIKQAAEEGNLFLNVKGRF